MKDKRRLVESIYENDVKIPLLSSALIWPEYESVCSSGDDYLAIEQLIAIRWKLTDR